MRRFPSSCMATRTILLQDTRFYGKSLLGYITTFNGQRWPVNMNHRALNRDDGSYLSQEYLRLVGK